jgi:hypothetical protein
MTDTQPDIFLKQLEIFRSKSDSERFQVSEELILFGRKIIESLILQETRNLSDIDLKIKVFRRCYADQYTAEELDRITDSMRHYLQTKIP